MYIYPFFFSKSNLQNNLLCLLFGLLLLKSPQAVAMERQYNNNNGTSSSLSSSVYMFFGLANSGKSSAIKALQMEIPPKRAESLRMPVGKALNPTFIDHRNMSLPQQYNSIAPSIRTELFEKPGLLSSFCDTCPLYFTPKRGLVIDDYLYYLAMKRHLIGGLILVLKASDTFHHVFLTTLLNSFACFLTKHFGDRSNWEDSVCLLVTNAKQQQKRVLYGVAQTQSKLLIPNLADKIVFFEPNTPESIKITLNKLGNLAVIDQQKLKPPCILAIHMQRMAIAIALYAHMLMHLKRTKATQTQIQKVFATLIDQKEDIDMLLLWCQDMIPYLQQKSEKSNINLSELTRNHLEAITIQIIMGLMAFEEATNQPIVDTEISQTFQQLLDKGIQNIYSHQCQTDISYTFQMQKGLTRYGYLFLFIAILAVLGNIWQYVLSQS